MKLPKASKLTIARIDALIWIFIYAGLVVLAVGLALINAGGPFAEAFMLVGAAVATIGVTLIFVRARMLRGRSPAEAEAHSNPVGGTR